MKSLTLCPCVTYGFVNSSMWAVLSTSKVQGKPSVLSIWCMMTNRMGMMPICAWCILICNILLWLQCSMTNRTIDKSILFCSYNVNHEFSSAHSVLPPINPQHQQQPNINQQPQLHPQNIPQQHQHPQSMQQQQQQQQHYSSQLAAQNIHQHQQNQMMNIPTAGDAGKCKECGSHSSMSHYPDYNGNSLPNIHSKFVWWSGIVHAALGITCVSTVAGNVTLPITMPSL